MMSFLVTHTGFFQTLDIIIIPKNTGKIRCRRKVILQLKLEDTWLSKGIEDMLHAMTCVSLPMLNLAMSMNLALLVCCVYMAAQ